MRPPSFVSSSASHPSPKSRFWTRIPRFRVIDVVHTPRDLHGHVVHVNHMKSYITRCSRTPSSRHMALSQTRHLIPFSDYSHSALRRPAMHRGVALVMRGGRGQVEVVCSTHCLTVLLSILLCELE